MPKVFISSTGEDLKDYRQAAIDVCNRQQFIPIAMEHFEAMGFGANEGSKRKLDESDVYVGIYAHRYGYIEAGSPVSVTEVEFDRAAERGMERLCFMLDPNIPWPPKYIDYTGHDKLEAFKKKVNTLVRAMFSSVDNFREQLTNALVEWNRRRVTRRVAVREIFEPLLHEYAVFGGREDALRRIREFIQGDDPGYLVVTAPAGFGKTALMAQLVNADRDAFAYHFFSSVYSSSGGEDLLSEKFFLRNVVQQMSAWHGRTDGLPESINELRGEYQRLLREPLTENRVLLLDGLDEVQTWRLRPYLNRQVGPKLRVLVSLRDNGQDWDSEYGFPSDQRQHLPLGGLTPADIQQMFQAVGGAAGTFAADDALLKRVASVAAYPQDPTLGADPLYVRFLAEDIAAGDITAANIDEQPRNLSAYFDDWFGRIRTALQESGVGAELFQILAVALGPIPRSDLVGMVPALGDPFAGFDAVLPLLRRAVAGSDRAGYALAHPRLRAYMQKYNLAPYAQRLLDYCLKWRTTQSHYAASFLIAHLKASGRTDDIYATIVDIKFQDMQRTVFGNIQATLSDVKLALEAAAERDELVPMLTCVAEYRRLIRAEGVTQGIFQAAGEGRFRKALELAASCEGGQRSGRWSTSLFCYLIWEAAQAGNIEAVRRFVAAGAGKLYQPGSFAEDLQRALLTRAARVLSAHTESSESTWLSQFGVTQAWPVPVAAPGTVMAPAEFDYRISDIEYQIGETRVAAVEFIDEERAGEYTVRLRDQLVAVAALPVGQSYIDRALKVIGNNPYPRYRDSALVGLGIAITAAPDVSWVRSRLQRVLGCGLDNEGVTFTFDLPAQLAAEGRRRGLPARSLDVYLNGALASTDRWGTRLRAHSACASALFWQGETPAALAALERAAASDEGFAGFISHHLLSLASRLCEFGLPDPARADALIAQSALHAERVRDPIFRQERLALTRDYRKWFDGPAPDAEEMDNVLAAISDAENRRSYKDLVSARWSYPAGTRLNDLKGLLPLGLADGTIIDTILGRLIGCRIQRHRAGVQPLSDADLVKLIEICSNNFTVSRPWEQVEPAVA